MSEVRCTLGFESVEAFRTSFEPLLQQGVCFVPYPDELADGSAMLVRLEVAERATVELQGAVLHSDFDEHGNIGVRVGLSSDSTALLGSVLEQLKAPGGPSQSIFKTTGRLAVPPTLVRPEATKGPAETRPEEPVLEPGTLLEERFQIEAHLATGGMGEVYRALHVHLNRPVALKLMRKVFATDADMWARFRREAELVSQLESQHIVRVFDFGKTQDGRLFLAMEYVEGTALSAMVAKGPLEPSLAVRLLGQVCDGLAEAHAQNIVHRDLKPANIMVGRRRDGSELAKILDFGIARLTDQRAEDRSLTQAGLVVGTPAYLAPEQALADELDQRTDIYAMGCVAFELLTGRPPFIADDLQRIVSQHLTAAPPALESLRPELATYGALCQAVLKALAKERERRFQTVMELRAALEAAVRTGATPAPVPTAPNLWPPEADVWPPPEFPASLPPPGPAPPASPGGDHRPARVDSADDFFSSVPSGPQVRPAAPPKTSVGRLKAALEAIDVSAPKVLLDWHENRRDALAETEGRVVVVSAALLGVAPRTPPFASLALRLLEIGRTWGGVLDAADEDHLVFLFAKEEPVAAGRAAYAAVNMRLSAGDDAQSQGEPVGAVRIGIAAGRAELGAQALDDALVHRARTVASAFPAGTVVVERSLGNELGSVVELRALPATDLFELGPRRSQVLKGATALLDREGVLSSFDRRISTLLQGVVAPVLVRGARGAGRSAVADELALHARQKGLVVGSARGHEALRGQPFGALTEIICNALGVPVRERALRLRPALERVGLTGAMLEATLVVTGVSQLPHTVTAGQAVQALRAVMRAGAKDRGVLLVFDGLEEMDARSVEAFAELVTRASQKELTVGFAEPELATDRLASAPALELTPLDSTHIARWTQLMTDGTPSPELVELLSRRSRGLPGLLLDWLHLLDDRAQLRRTEGVVGVVGEVPELHDEALIHARYEALSWDVRRVIEAAALIGTSFDPAAVAVAWPKVTQAAVQRAVASNLLRAAPGRRLAWSSPRVQRIIARNPSPAAKLMHLRLATSLIEQGRADPTSVDAALVARHLTEAGDGIRAVALWRHAAETALARRAPRDAVVAIRGWSDALALVADQPEVARSRIDALARAANIAVTVQDPGLARTLVDEALAHSRKANLGSAELCLAMAKVLRSEARRARATEALTQAAALAQNTPLAALIEAERGEAREQEGDLAGAITAFEAALNTAEKAQDLARWHGEIDLEARLTARLAAVHLQRKETAAALGLFERSLVRWRRDQWPFAEARVLANLGTLFAHAKEPAQAVKSFEAAAKAAARSGDTLFQARQLLMLAKAAKKSDPNRARAAANEARALCIALGWEEGRTQAEGIA